MSAEANSPPSSDVGTVELTVPLVAQYASTVRTVAAALGADAGFSVDELDDIRLSLSEVFSALVDDAEAAATARASVSFSIGVGMVRVEVRTDRDANSIDLDDLALGILRSVTDHLEVTSTTVAFVKHATEAIPGSSTP